MLVASGALLALPRQWAPLPLLAGACYMTLGQGIELGPFSFTLIRILLLVGIVRVLARGERPAGGFIGLDWIMIAWAVWALICPVFRKEPADTLVFHMGRVYTYLSLYFLMRSFCHDWQDVLRLVQMIALVLVPVSLEMVAEQVTGKNFFSALGGVPEQAVIRNGRLRSQGPFSHAILAGTVGAVTIPLMAGLYRINRIPALVGLGAALLMVLASASSGPIMTVLFGLFALALWRWRQYTRHMQIAAVAGYILLDIVMKAPAYFLIAKIDFVGGSTGYHRAAIMSAGIKHFSEWWLAGTDYTRHWMPYGVSWSPDHADITNHYLAQGVMGGAMLMILFMSALWCAFRYVGKTLKSHDDQPINVQFLIWCIGASLFAHAATFVSVAYFDQSVFFLYMTLALTGSLVTHGPDEQPPEEDELDQESDGEASGNHTGRARYEVMSA